MVFVSVLLCLGGMARAQTLYHCRAQGVSSYQQSPCPASSRMVGSVETAPEHAPSESQRRARIERAEEDRAESAFLSHSAGTDNGTTKSPGRKGRVSGRTSQRNACQEARTAKSTALKALGLKRSYDVLQSLDRSVADACRHG
jgi:hypothetical protein